MPDPSAARGYNGYPQHGGYPQNQGGYPNQQGGYPNQQGYPGQDGYGQGGYPDPSQGGYPPNQQGGYREQHSTDSESHVPVPIRVPKAKKKSVSRPGAQPQYEPEGYGDRPPLARGSPLIGTPDVGE